MSCKDCNDCKCTDPWHKSSPVQEYEDRKSVTLQDFKFALLALVRKDWDEVETYWRSLQEDQTEELKDDVSTLRRRIKELEQQIAKELR